MGQRLYVENLSSEASVDSLRSIFSGARAVNVLHVVMDRAKRRVREFDVVTTNSDNDGTGATKTFDRTVTHSTMTNGAMVDDTIVEERSLLLNESEERQNGGGDGCRGGRY